jgi:hypothetical protein
MAIVLAAVAFLLGVVALGLGVAVIRRGVMPAGAAAGLGGLCAVVLAIAAALRA